MSLWKAVFLVSWLGIFSPAFSAESKAPVQTLADGTRVFGKASMRNHRGIWVLNLFGTREEMAEQHGALVSDRINDVALPYFAHKIDMSVAQIYIVKQFPFLSGIIETAIDWFVMAPLRHHVPDEDQKVAEAFAHGAAVDEETVLNAMIMPDVGQYLVAKVFGEDRISAGTFVPPTGLGCSTLVVRSDRTNTGLIHARNLDYEGYDLWEKFPAVIYYHPSEPGTLNYLSVSSLGIPTAGITSANEAGLTLSLHQTLLESSSLSQNPILPITEKVIRSARTIDQALEILKGESFATSWKIVLSSATEDRAVEVDVASHGIEVREMQGDHHAVTNNVDGPLMKPFEFSSSYETLVDSLARKKNLEHMMAQKRKKISLQDGIDILSSPDHSTEDDTRALDRVGPGSVAKLNNVQSVVFLPSARIFYLANPLGEGQKPTEGEYVPLPLDMSALVTEDGLRNSLSAMPESLRRSHPISETKAKAQGIFRVAAKKINDEGDWNQALFLMIEAGETDPAEAFYPMNAAFVIFKTLAWAEKDERWILVNRTRTMFKRAKDLGLSAYHRSLVDFFLARLDDLQGQRAVALEKYKAIDFSKSKVLAEAVHKALESAYDYGDVKDLTINFLEGDVFKF